MTWSCPGESAVFSWDVGLHGRIEPKGTQRKFQGVR